MKNNIVLNKSFVIEYPIWHTLLCFCTLFCFFCCTFYLKNYNANTKGENKLKAMNKIMIIYLS